MEKVIKRLKITNEHGLHARAAALLVETVNRFTSDIKLSRNGQVAEGKSIISVLTLGAAKGSNVRVEAKGKDAKEAVRAIEILVRDNFHESK